MSRTLWVLPAGVSLHAQLTLSIAEFTRQLSQARASLLRASLSDRLDEKSIRHGAEAVGAAELALGTASVLEDSISVGVPVPGSLPVGEPGAQGNEGE